jgi:hypothetical protein
MSLSARIVVVNRRKNFVASAWFGSGAAIAVTTRTFPSANGPSGNLPPIDHSSGFFALIRMPIRSGSSDHP